MNHPYLSIIHPYLSRKYRLIQTAETDFPAEADVLIFLPGHGHQPESIEIAKIQHLLGLIHESWQPLPVEGKTERISSRVATSSIQTWYLRKSNDVRRRLARCATDLIDAGIKFRKSKSSNIFDIRFNKGVMEIPPMKIENKTEKLMHNIFAYEQLTYTDTLKYISEYMKFMDRLIISEKDVELLCRHGTIDNLLGDNETVAALFNNCGGDVFCTWELYGDIQEDVKRHCDKTWNVWKAKLKHDYFNTPWSVISVVAAVYLLLFTLAQTVYSVTSYY